MKICEGCIKQDVCKFKAEVEKYEVKRLKVLGIPKPLVPDLSCKYKRQEQSWTYTTPNTTSTTYIPDTTIYNTYTPWYTIRDDGSQVLVV